MRLRWPGAVLIAAMVFSGCGSGASTTPTPSGLTGSITVFAASSLTASFAALGQDFQKAHPGTTAHLTFAGSSTLAAQIQQGAIGDVFASADQANMQKLLDAGLLEGAPLTFARNRLQIVVAKGNPKHIAGLADLSRQDLIVVLCAPAVPCGRYASQALQRAGVSVTLASQEADVKAVLSKVALGEADAGIVYLTDVKAAGSGVQGIEISPSVNVVADYPLAVLKESQNIPLAKAFIGYLLGEGQRTLARYGFTSP